MNIFLTNADPIISVRELCDQHINCGIAEATAIANDALLNLGIATGLKPMHPHHPLVKWATNSENNLDFVMTHVALIHNERKRRWPNRPIHRAMERWTELNGLMAFCFDDCNPYDHGPFIRGMDMQKHGLAISNDVHIDYQRRLNYKFDAWAQQGRPPTWTGVDIPKWYNP